MRQLGCNAYRFSLEWSKLEPAKGRFDPAAFRHYHQLLDALQAAGIEPMVTLHHFSHPTWYQMA
jgi:beta-glucosidase